MGGGSWTTDVYTYRTNKKIAQGKDIFDYDDQVKDLPQTDWKAHKNLDPKRKNTLGKKVRESRDSKDHPESNAIAVLFDVTGSMGGIPRVLQTKLPKLLGILTRKAYLSDPQILFGAVGDANSDRVPLQIGEFESDNRLDENLENIFLEGGGGGQRHETYELGLYYIARHTETDCFVKRGKKGYLFTIGDEMPYPKIKAAQVREVTGDTIENSLDTADMVAEVSRRYHYFHIIASGGAHGQESEVAETWKKLLGERVLRLDDPDAVCETIALAIGLTEEAFEDLDTGIRDLAKMGADMASARAASKSLVAYSGVVAKSRATGKGGLLPGLSGTSGIKRLR